ncbi:MAG: hypothetical protein U5L96_08230 [Owenweeksia sp.]|nr:hypothetical protein [Owenweeksia sp.]
MFHPVLIFPDVTNAQLSFYYAQEVDILGLSNGLKVYVRSAGSSNWTEVFSDMQGKYTWTYQEVVLPLNLGNDTIEIAFEGISGSSLIGGVLDNIKVSSGPSCVAPTALSVSNTTNNSALLSWQERSPAANFEVWYGPQFFYMGTQTATGTKTFTSNDFLPLNTLAGDSCYEFLVRTICPSGDTSTWTGPIEFCTDCPAQATPYFEDFENALDTLPPNCWTNVKGEGMADWLFNGQTSEKPTAAQGDHTKGPGGGGIMAWLDGSSNENFTNLLSPNIDISGLSQPQLTFWFWSETNDNSVTRQFRYTSMLEMLPVGLIMWPFMM